MDERCPVCSHAVAYEAPTTCTKCGTHWGSNAMRWFRPLSKRALERSRPLWLAVHAQKEQGEQGYRLLAPSELVRVRIIPRASSLFASLAFGCCGACVFLLLFVEKVPMSWGQLQADLSFVPLFLSLASSFFALSYLTWHFLRKGLRNAGTLCLDARELVLRYPFRLRFPREVRCPRSQFTSVGLRATDDLLEVWLLTSSGTALRVVDGLFRNEAYLIYDALERQLGGATNPR